MLERNTYATSLLAVWFCLWATVMLLIGILITFNVKDTYFVSAGAPDEATTDAVILGLGTVAFGALLFVVGVGLWAIRAWAWWIATVLVGISFVADIVNFARTVTLLATLPDDLPRQMAVWPILMWREPMTFLGTDSNEVLLVGWPILVHLIVSLVVLLVLVSPQFRELFGVALAEEAIPAGGPRPVGLEATRVPQRPGRAEEPAATAQYGASPRRLAYLIVQTGQLAGQSFQLKDQTTIGRSKRENDIALDDNGVSRQHAIVRLENGRFVFMDRGSLNRSFLVTSSGKQEITKQVLEDGDELLLGDTRVLYREGQAKA